MFNYPLIKISLFLINILICLRAYTLHPLVLIITLILCTRLVASKTYIITKAALFRYIIILILLGGLIILFIYIASIAPNEPIPTKNFKVIFLRVSRATAIILIIKLQSTPSQISNPIEIILLINNICLITIVATYLFITLVAVVQITKITEGPLRSNF